MSKPIKLYSLHQFFYIALLVLISSCARQFMVIDKPAKMPPPLQLEKSPRIALVLGGGAFHGAAHLGVLKVLEEEGMTIDMIVGASAGSFVGALYADCPHSDSLTDLITNTKTKSVFDFSIFRSSEGFISGKRLQNFLEDHLHVSNIEDLKIPFIAVTTDIEQAKSVYLSSGPVAPSVNASCAIPYIFEPVKMYGTTYVDGGVLDNLPVDVAKNYGAEVIVAVDIMADFDTVPILKNNIDVLIRSFKVSSHVLKEIREPIADIVIAPNLKDMPLMSSKNNEKVYQAGIKAAREKLPAIKAKLEEKGIR
ncbi:MAG: patatin-like phospholipase family protein [Bacteroidales bacterium]|nr:patatin-like phospholipase family protein [Bacteroidales bacterium]MCF8343477.1 patatin-like phospholipase family protein [Bacteroidales bacterium]MCF8376948.1 patatin-like phospholipase family protein [Bacteroidales bacterium]MCF8401290.1 patatin-like phospholipase family protein [Bacteroidales bacterium]